MATFLVSAFWHGFHPFTYACFFVAAICVEVAKDLYKARIIFSFIPSVIRPLIANFLTMLALNYLGTLHNAMSFENGFIFCGATYYFVIIGSILILATSRIFGLVKYAQKLEKKEKVEPFADT